MGSEPEQKPESKETEVEAKTEAETKSKSSYRLASGEEVQLEKTEVETVLNQAQQYASYIKKLQSDGVIDDQGNVIKPAAIEKEEEEELDDNARLLRRIEELEQKAEQTEQKAKTDSILNKVNAQLAACGQRHDETRDDSEFKTLVELQVLGQYYMNPSANISSLYDNTIKQFNKAFDKKQKSYLEAKMKQTTRKGDGPGGSTGVAREKPFTREDMVSGAVRRAAFERLQAAKEIG